MLIILTLASMLLALVMSVVAWRASSEERRRSQARIAALALEIQSPSPLGEAHLRPPDSSDADLHPLGFGEAHLRLSNDREARLRPVGFGAASKDMFAVTTPSAASGSQWGLALAAGAFVVVSIAAAAIVFSGESPSAATVARPAPAAPAPVAAVPLELVALVHERDGDRLTVRGVVRNPASGMEMDRLTAVVFLFDRNGGFLSSGRAAVASPSLLPGGESTFVVTVPASDDVGRYRVSFRSYDRVISHIDKRSAS